MSISKSLEFKKPQLKAFAVLFREARLKKHMSQLAVANAAFEYRKSHCKVSRVERCVMPRVDAHCLERIAKVLDIPVRELEAIDPHFKARASVVRAATRKGFWAYPAALGALPS